MRTFRYWIMRVMGSRLKSRNELLSLMEYRAVSSTSSAMRELLYRRASCSRARSYSNALLTFALELHVVSSGPMPWSSRVDLLPLLTPNNK